MKKTKITNQLLLCLLIISTYKIIPSTNSSQDQYSQNISLPQVTFKNISKKTAKIKSITVNYTLSDNSKNSTPPNIISIIIKPGQSALINPTLSISTTNNSSIKNPYISTIQVGNDSINIQQLAPFSEICIDQKNKTWVLAPDCKKTKESTDKSSTTVIENKNSKIQKSKTINTTSNQQPQFAQSQQEQQFNQQPKFIQPNQIPNLNQQPEFAQPQQEQQFNQQPEFAQPNQRPQFNQQPQLAQSQQEQQFNQQTEFIQPNLIPNLNQQPNLAQSQQEQQFNQQPQFAQSQLGPQFNQQQPGPQFNQQNEFIQPNQRPQFNQQPELAQPLQIEQIQPNQIQAK